MLLAGLVVFGAAARIGARATMAAGILLGGTGLALMADALTAAETDARGPALIRAAQESFVDGWQQAMWAGVAVMTALFVSVLTRGPRPGVPAQEALAG